MSQTCEFRATIRIILNVVMIVTLSVPFEWNFYEECFIRGFCWQKFIFSPWSQIFSVPTGTWTRTWVKNCQSDKLEFFVSIRFIGIRKMLDAGCVNVFMSFHAQARTPLGTPLHQLWPTSWQHFVVSGERACRKRFPAFFRNIAVISLRRCERGFSRHSADPGSDDKKREFLN